MNRDPAYGRSVHAPRWDQVEAFVFDLDGTVVPNGYSGAPSPELACLVRRLRRSRRFCVATGRPWSSCARVVNRLGIRDLCIVAGGAEIIDPATGSAVWQTKLSEESVDRVLQVCRPYPYEILFDDASIGEGQSAREYRGAREATVMYIMNVDEADARSVVRGLSGLAGIACRLSKPWSGSGADLHVTTEEGTKGRSVLRLWSMLGVDRNATVAFGDGDNDLDLFEAVAWRVAVQGGSSALAQHADDSCPPPDRDGVAAYISGMAGVRACSQGRLSTSSRSACVQPPVRPVSGTRHHQD